MAQQKTRFAWVFAIGIVLFIVFFNRHHASEKSGSESQEVSKVSDSSKKGHSTAVASDCTQLQGLVKNVEMEDEILRKEHERTLKESENLRKAMAINGEACANARPGKANKCNPALMGMLQGQTSQIQGRLDQISNSAIELIRNRDRLRNEMKLKNCQLAAESQGSPETNRSPAATK